MATAKEVKYLYFPSCNFTRLFPDVSEKLKSFLASRGVEIAGCCRKSYDRLPEDIVPLTICQTCAIIIGENNPEQPPVSIFEYLDALSDLDLPDHTGERIVLQDCFRARTHMAEKKAVRSLLQKMGFVIEDAPDQEGFDGRFLMRPMMPGNLKLAPKTFSILETYADPCAPEEGLRRLQAYASGIGQDAVVSYCSACWQGLREGLPESARCLHIAQLLTEHM
ncbi:MAG: hypothetical protein K6A77_00465 [Clostridiales bacterium]|nr:hypothetical protein [Clostridiales bacterium]